MYQSHLYESGLFLSSHSLENGALQKIFVTLLGGVVLYGSTATVTSRRYRERDYCAEKQMGDKGGGEERETYM